ncbi:CHC2 zinc finger domain protein [Bacteroides sp. 2_1_22]|nr:CHC2 zinc finger domain protein [Bacteroides sp. 2_1_22]
MLQQKFNKGSTSFSFHYIFSTIQQFNNIKIMNSLDNKNIQIADFLAEKGYLPISKKGANWWYLSPLHNENTASFKVNVDKNVWYDFGLGKGGGLATLVNLLYHPNNFQDYLHHLSGIRTSFPSTPKTTREGSETFSNVEVKSLANSALLKYLGKRGIAQQVASQYCKEVHYQNRDKSYFAVGFPNRSGGYEIRNAYFKGCISPKDISVISKGNKDCHVFEGFIDFLSYVVLHGDCDAIVLNSVINVPKSIDYLNRYDTVYCHLDNDKAGHDATEQIRILCKGNVIDASEEYGEAKDLNEFLCKRMNSQGQVLSCGFKR